MPPQRPASNDLIEEALRRFDLYARMRAGRDSLLRTQRSSPQDEDKAFQELEAVMARLREKQR
ncbi:hypothetical protein ACWERI_28445 [Streptomyces collinus]|uniref:hypothetical protein n=1 Tax=Streptomyces collinus TaxID=42684 RepID=UPI0036CBAF28